MRLLSSSSRLLGVRELSGGGVTGAVVGERGSYIFGRSFNVGGTEYSFARKCLIAEGLGGVVVRDGVADGAEGMFNCGDAGAGLRAFTVAFVAVVGISTTTDCKTTGCKSIHCKMTGRS